MEEELVDYFLFDENAENFPSFCIDSELTAQVETNTPKENLRFATLSDNELEKILEGKHSEKTKKTTKWAVSTFKGKHFELII
jgi:hypothetical protein